LFSLFNRHWFGLFEQLGHLGSFHYHSFNFHGTWAVTAATFGIILVGALLTPLIIRQSPPLAERVLWTVIVTIAIVALTTVLLALFGDLYLEVLIVALSLIGVATIALSYGLGGKSFSPVVQWWFEPTIAPTLGARWSGSRLWRSVCYVYLGIAALVLMFHSITTPIVDYDSLIYHAAMAKILAHSHGMPLITGPSPGLEMSANYPPLYPALGAFTLVFSHGNDLFLRLLAPLADIATAGAAFAIARRYGGLMMGLCAAVFTLTAQIVSLYGVYDNVYPFMGLLVAVAFLALISYVSDHSLGSLTLLGLSLGLLFLCSYQAAIYLVWIPSIVWLLWSTREQRKLAPQFLAVMAPLVLVGGFWYIRNWAVLGDPVYPWFHHFFGGRGLSSPLTSLAQASVTNVAQSLAYTAQGPSRLLDLLGILLFNRNFFPALSPIALLGFFLAIRHSAKHSLERSALWLIIPGAVLPIALFIISGTFFFRYFIPAVPILAVLPAYALRHLVLEVPHQRILSTVRKRLGLTLLLYVMIFPGTFVLLAGAYYYEYYDFQPQRTFLSSWMSINPSPTSEAIANDYPGDGSFTWIEDHLSSHALVATYESRLYYLFNANWRRILFLDGNGVNPIWNQENPSTVSHYLRTKGVQYIWLSNIVEVGSSHLPLVRHMVGNTPVFPEVWQSYADIVYGDRPMKLGIGETPDVYMSNVAMWSRIRIVGGVPARAILSPDPASADHPDPATVLITNGRRPGIVSFEYRTPRHVNSSSTIAVDVSSNRNWSAVVPNIWQRLLTTTMVGPGQWHTAFVTVKPDQPFGVTRLGLRSSDGPVFIRRVAFVPLPQSSSNITLHGSWSVGKIDGQVFFQGRRSTNPVAVKNIFSDVVVALSPHGLPYVDVHFLDGTGTVNVAEKIGTEEVPIGTILEGDTNTLRTQRLPLVPSRLTSHSAYLIFDTQGNLFSFSSLDQIPEATSSDTWEPIEYQYEGNWRAARVDGTVAAIAHRGDGDFTDLLISDVSTNRVNAWRLEYLDVPSAKLIVTALDKSGKGHVLATVHTTGSNQVRYVNITAAQEFDIPGGGHYLVLDTDNTSVPILGVQATLVK
jgi:4-amino-4-deoxy-L-arabinose transferase-like glycosyltransferase